MFPQFDPSKMDPKILMELSQLIQQLPPASLNKMQTLMHNAMAGYDVKAEMAAFERDLPPGFKEKLTALISSNPTAFAPMAGMAGGFGGEPPAQSPIQPMSYTGAESASSDSHAADMDMHEARMTVLRGVATGQVTPEDAEKLLFGA